MVNDWSCARARLYDFYNKSKFINNIFVRWEGNSPREKKYTPTFMVIRFLAEGVY